MAQNEAMALEVKEIAKTLRLSQPVVYDLLHSGKLPGFKVGKKWLVPIKALERWLDEHIGKEF